ncbi:MAG: hypothetical protein KY450_06955 [Actinobacteria bacterium]|nr:hypothetical protein [Actinomycetota bacterium]
METNPQTGHDTTHQPGDDQTHEPAEHGGKSAKTLSSDLAEEDVNTPEQRNQAWTPGPGREGGDPLRIEGTTAPPLDMPPALEDKMDDVMANPHSDAQDTTDTQGDPEEKLGGLPVSGDVAQDPGTTTGGSSH